MVARDLCKTERGLRPGHPEMVASGISPAAPGIARADGYDEATLWRGLPDGFERRHFRRDSRSWAVDDEIKRMVTFRKFNPRDAPGSFGRFGIVFFRYLTVCFSNALRRGADRELAGSRGSGTNLKAGAVQILRGICAGVELFEHAAGRYGRRTGIRTDAIAPKAGRCMQTTDCSG
jgi:chemotaxis protein methyltransferase CheR